MVVFSTLALFAGIATAAAASNIKNLVVFGDSNSGKSTGMAFASASWLTTAGRCWKQPALVKRACVERIPGGWMERIAV